MLLRQVGVFPARWKCSLFLGSNLIYFLPSLTSSQNIFFNHVSSLAVPRKKKKQYHTHETNHHNCPTTPSRKHACVSLWGKICQSTHETTLAAWKRSWGCVIVHSSVRTFCLHKDKYPMNFIPSTVPIHKLRSVWMGSLHNINA
jgi:hypothetical protein